MPASEKPDMKERILETADRLFYLQRHSRRRRRHHRRRNRHQQAHALQSLPVKGCVDLGLSGTPLRAASRRPTSRRSNRSWHLRFGWSGGFASKGLSRLPFVNAVAELGAEDRSGEKDRDRLQGKPPPLVSRSVGAARRRRRRRRWRPSSLCWSTARSRRTSCATIPRWRARRRRPRGCCWRMPV